jgi:hypothetical protein
LAERKTYMEKLRGDFCEDSIVKIISIYLSCVDLIQSCDTTLHFNLSKLIIFTLHVLLDFILTLEHYI